MLEALGGRTTRARGGRCHTSISASTVKCTNAAKAQPFLVDGDRRDGAPRQRRFVLSDWTPGRPGLREQSREQEFIGQPHVYACVRPGAALTQPPGDGGSLHHLQDACRLSKAFWPFRSRLTWFLHTDVSCASRSRSSQELTCPQRSTGVR